MFRIDSRPRRSWLGSFLQIGEILFSRLSKQDYQIPSPCITHVRVYLKGCDYGALRCFCTRGFFWLSILPLALVFSIDIVGVEGLNELVIAKDTTNRLIMDETKTSVIKAIAKTYTDNEGGLFFRQLLLFHGSLGTGKTGRFAEFAGPPRLHLATADLCHKPKDLENGIMDFCQADVYLEACSIKNLKRNIYLSTLNYFRASLSRIHVSIVYERLHDSTPAQMWDKSFVKLKNDARQYVKKNEDVRNLQWNGRETCNETQSSAFRTAIALALNDSKEANEKKSKQSTFAQVVKLSSGFKKYMKNQDDDADTPKRQRGGGGMSEAWHNLACIACRIALLAPQAWTDHYEIAPSIVYGVPRPRPVVGYIVASLMIQYFIERLQGSISGYSEIGAGGQSHPCYPCRKCLHQPFRLVEPAGGETARDLGQPRLPCPGGGVIHHPPTVMLASMIAPLRSKTLPSSMRQRSQPAGFRAAERHSDVTPDVRNSTIYLSRSCGQQMSGLSPPAPIEQSQTPIIPDS
ncbi:uncharacterized protein BDR25DRAFT_348614 [Lindgomyces ingoldianus]|uniref:Uncharacterized protein n=1 Tax=Lindgomyces ingoldianus TaxID=673940 RepID=A0ACB6RI10_9PLEO|nr:uncharacterized protein BDR25DRAFT_348614 [Lindgomyces ingoldianus]KAF2478360.1 hypothetical protein BDR25DRAFT_348614 [Lindgomyces ingoldianus]